MTTYRTQELLDSLTADVTAIVKSVRELSEKSEELLCTPPAEGKWNVLQIIWHLQSYNQYYLTAITAGMKTAPAGRPEAVYQPGFIGDYFTRLMQPAASGKAKGMKAPAAHTPKLLYTDKAILNDFLKSQEQLLQLLQAARGVNMGRIKIPVSISTLIKIRLGDTFRFLIAHQQRHMLQVRNTLHQNATLIPNGI